MFAANYYATWYPQRPPHPNYGMYRPQQMYHYQAPNQKPAPWYCMQYPSAQGCASATNANCPRHVPGRTEDCSTNDDESKTILMWSEAKLKTTTFELFCPEDKKVKLIFETIEPSPLAANGECDSGLRKNVKGTGDVEADWGEWECDKKGPFIPWLTNGEVVEGESNEMQLQFKATAAAAAATTNIFAMSFNCQCA
ncbi:uncharacterized protein LOC141914221 [Tubulanus polymorphus]|uniref:uncharacterized protein LOC141914221 n=1 Tax=Tubulanus polymorphus TaxID=672921 RepID=UPI003DA2D894